MEGYIKRINDKLVEKNDEKHAKKVKMTYLIVGGVILGVGLAGFLASFITFMVLFFKFKTDDAFTAWIVAVPFLLFIVAGSVLTRIGDALLPKGKFFFKKRAMQADEVNASEGQDEQAADGQDGQENAAERQN